MLKKTAAWITSAGETHATLEGAQASELCALLGIELEEVKTIVQNSDKVVDILTTTERSIPSARAVNGGRKPRKPKPQTGNLPGMPTSELSV